MQSIGQSINRPTNQSINQSINHSINQSILSATATWASNDLHCCGNSIRWGGPVVNKKKKIEVRAKLLGPYTTDDEYTSHTQPWRGFLSSIARQTKRVPVPIPNDTSPESSGRDDSNADLLGRDTISKFGDTDTNHGKKNRHRGVW